MIDLPTPGIHVVRAPDAAGFAKNLLTHWLDSQEETPFPSCLWLTASPTAEVRSLLEPWLQDRRHAPKGLEVVSIRKLQNRGRSNEGIRELCRSMNTLCVLDPVLVVIEQGHLWFNSDREPLARRNPMAEMRLLDQWALHARAHVVIPVQGDLPEWSTFAGGLADVTSQGALEFQPWWPTEWGMQTRLWNDTNQFRGVPVHRVLDSRQFNSLKSLAQACHGMRHGDQQPMALHVQAHGEVSPQDASALLRLGADTVWYQPQKIDRWLGVHTTTCSPESLSAHSSLAAGSGSFAQDWHEVFMPGLLTVVPNPTFAIQGLMMLELAERWSMYCTVTRLSLMGHMTAQTALRLAHWAHATGVFTATREAVYILRVWENEPDETQYRQWLEGCFREQLPVLFSGDIQFPGRQAQAALLSDLHEELEPLTVHDLLGEDLPEQQRLAELWEASRQEQSVHRPWMNRLNQLIPGARS